MNSVSSCPGPLKEKNKEKSKTDKAARNGQDHH